MRKMTVGRRVAGAAVALGLVLAAAGCGSMTAEDLKAVLSGVTDVARTAGEFEANRRAGRANATPQAQAAQPQAERAAAPATYGALSCTRPVARNGMACFENGCGRVVVLHARAGNGATGSAAMQPGQCMAIAPGTIGFACQAGDRFDWQRVSCISS